MESDAVIVEVALNEDVPRTRHEHVPRRPNECALDAIRCAEAGAVVVHWHAIDAEGQPRLGDAALYGAALDAMDGRILAYPSYRVDVPATVPDRLGHCLELRARHQMELAPLDVATVNVFAKDADGLVPTLAAFDLGSTRAISALAGSGLLPEPVLLKIFLWESPIIGPRPSVEALDLHLRQLAPDLDVEWLVVTYGMTDPEALEAIARAALERGGGVRIGIGDSPRAFPDLSNPQMVELVVRWAADAGRPVAGLSAVRKRLGTSPVQGEAVP
jgi:3-keto-5-aminohexanoate cleavage enzyme